MTTEMTETAQAWARYQAWNDAIETEFFDGQSAGRPVYLDMEDEVVVRLAESAGADGDPRSEFARAVMPTLYLPSESGGRLLDLHCSRLRRWRRERQAMAPPCLAALALFSLAAEGMRGDGVFGANNYYARLCELLGIDAAKKPAYRDRVANEFRQGSLELWDGLNSWLSDHGGALGTPTAYSFDWRSYVSVPISQALLRLEERLALREALHRVPPQPGPTTSDERHAALAQGMASTRGRLAYAQAPV